MDLDSGAATIIEPPTKDQGARRVWSDSGGRIWVSEWNSGNVSRYDPKTGGWRTWRLPGERPRAYAVYVDDRDKVWVSDWGANAMVRFDPETEKFEVFPSDRRRANVRQILGRPGEVWAPRPRDRPQPCISPVLGSSRPYTPLWPVNQIRPRLSKVGVLRFT